MNYLKNWNLFESIDLYEEIKSKVNLNIIDDIKYLSLDYIDDGWSLYFFVKIGDSTNIKYENDAYHRSFDNILSGFADSKKEWMNWNSVKNNSNSLSTNLEILNDTGLSYYFTLIKPGLSEYIRTIRTVGDILSTISSIYSNEKIMTY